jgi:hypothetical protein
MICIETIFYQVLMVLLSLSILSATIAELFAEKKNAMPKIFSQNLVVHPQDPCPITCISSHNIQKDVKKGSPLEFITSLNLVERFGLTPQTDTNAVFDEVDGRNRVDKQFPTNGGASRPCLWYICGGYPLWLLLAPPSSNPWQLSAPANCPMPFAPCCSPCPSLLA